jgi:hypothetical protein
MAKEPIGLPSAPRRAIAALAAIALLTTLTQVAWAEPSTKDKLEAAKAEFERLKDDIAAQQQVVSALLLEAQRIAERREVAYGQWQDITARLLETRKALGEAQAEYQGLKVDLEVRARGLHHWPGIGPGVLARGHIDLRPVIPDGVRERTQPVGRRPRDRGPEPPQRARSQQTGAGTPRDEGGGCARARSGAGGRGEGQAG